MTIFYRPGSEGHTKGKSRHLIQRKEHSVMSVSSLPEWKQLLLERKRREEGERERREKEEEEKLASMPAWKRGIIQRRRAKQEVVGDRDREREGVFLAVDGKPPYDGLCNLDSSVMVRLGSEPSLSPDLSQWLDDGDTSRPQSQVSMETIVPVHKNPFIRTQSGWRGGREAERAGEVGCHEKGQELKTEVGKDTEREKDKPAPRGHDGELGGGRDSKLKMERYRDKSEERERDRSTGKESIREREGDRESLKGSKEIEERDSDHPSPLFPPLVPGLRTIRADNIIIIEQGRKGGNERRGRRRETQRERLEEDHQEKRGVKMDLREILAGGGSVTEIRTSEVLIIKPSVGSEDRSGGGGGGEGKGSGKEDGEREREVKCTRDGENAGTGREQRSEPSWLRDKENRTFKEKERPWGQATVIKEDRKDSSDDSVFVERGGRVSQLLSKFGEHPRPPSRSKSIDCFIRPGRDEDSGVNDDDPSKEGRADGKNSGFRGVPKRSYSFSDWVVCAKENGMIDEGQRKMKVVERAHSDRRVTPRGEATEEVGSEKGSVLQIKRAWSRFSDKNWVGKEKDGFIKIGRQPEEHTERKRVMVNDTRSESEVCASTQQRAEISAVEKVEPVDKRVVEMADDVHGDEGFTVASVKNTEGISFARRVPIRQDGRVRAVEREVNRLREENVRGLERERGIERGSAGGRQAEPPVGERRGAEFRRGEGKEGNISAETLQQNCAINVSVDPACPPHIVDTHYRHASAFTECSGLLSAVAHRPGDLHRGSAEWSSVGPQGHCPAQTVLSQHTEELISKIERIGETMVYNSERGERAYRSYYEVSKENTPTHNAQIYSDVCMETLSQDVTSNSPRRPTSTGIPTTPLEIQIPRTVFYGAEEMLERKRASSQSDEGQDRDGGKGVERRDSWRIGKPLSRIESLREKIRQRERERMRSTEREGEDGGEGDGTENTVTQRGGDVYEERGIEMEREWEASAHIKKGLTETERAQEGLAAQTSSAAAFDVTQEVSKTSPQLPVSLLFSRAVGGEEETSEFTTVVSKAISASFQLSEDENEPLKYVEEQLRSDRGWQRGHHSRGEEREEEEDELSEEEKYNKSPLSTSESISPSPSHPNPLDAMSRIYNLKTVGSRTGLCVSERAVDIPPVHLVEVQPRVSHKQQESRNLDTADVRKLWGVGKHWDNSNKACSGEDVTGVQTVQRQIEQFQLRQQEVRRPLHDDGDKQNTLWDRETKGQLSPRRVRPQAKEDNLKMQQRDQRPLTVSPRLGAQQVCSPTSLLKQAQSNQSRTVSVTPRSFRSQSPDNSVKPLGCPCTPASSPCSPSPSPSPNVSPSPCSSPTLFSIRSASGGHVKRGATITIAPRKPVGDTAAVATPAGLSNTKTPAQQAQTTTVVDDTEPVKKRYPTVEEIEVIGGYQNLERSCLIKSRGTPRRVSANTGQ